MKSLIRILLTILGVILIAAGSGDARDCYNSSIVNPSPFLGNQGEIFTLDDGSTWKVINEYKYLYVYTPEVLICPPLGTLTVNGKSLNVEQLSKGKPLIKSLNPEPPSEAIIEYK